MKTMRTIALAAVAGAVLVSGVTALVKSQDGDVPALPEQPHTGGIELVHAQPFELAEGYPHFWRQERPQVSSGYLVVLKVDDPALLYPRQLAQPVLFCGDQTVERINTGYSSGFVVGVVPTDGALDLATAPFFFGRPALPEQLDARAIRGELEAARANGVAPQPATRVADAMKTAMSFRDGYELHLHASDLVEIYAPQEEDLINGLRAPRVGG